MAKKFDKVTSLESLEAKLAEMREAQAIYSKFTQEQVDEICKQAAMAADKAVSKRIMESCGVLTPKWSEITYTEADIPALRESLPVPCAVKVVGGGSSIGVALPDTREELESALRDILQYGNRVIVEEKIQGRELTQPVLGDRYLSTIEIVPPEGMTFDYVAKYQSGALAAQEICPAPITEEEHRLVGDRLQS